MGKNIEQQLLGQESETQDAYLSLEDTASEDGLYVGIETEDFQGRKTVDKTLEGEKAMAFLGLPKRLHNHLRRGDLTRIEERFERHLARLQKKHETNLFWENIQIRVWNKQNLAALNGKEIRGKKTRALPSLGMEGVEYKGDTFDGRALSDFLSEVANATKWREYFVQLVSVNVTEEMARA